MYSISDCKCLMINKNILQKNSVDHREDIFVPQNQCDQMARLFFNILPFTTMKISPKYKVLPKLFQNVAEH